jgi:hypothetical protein
MKVAARRPVSQGEMALRTARPLKAGPSAAQVEVERAMWSPNPDPLRGFVEDHFWNIGTRFLRDFASLVLGKQVQIAKADGMPKPPGWGDVMKLFEAGGEPAHQMASWSSLIDGFVQALLPAHTAEDAARVWALRSAMLGTIEERIKAITTPGAWDGYFHTMPPAQQHIADWTAIRGARFITRLTDSARQKALDVLVEANLNGTQPKGLASVFMERMGELNRDWRRIAITETAMAISNGQLAAVADSGEWEAVWVAGPNACPSCRKHFGRVFQIVSKMKPGMDPEKVIAPGRNNVGRSAHLYRRDGTKRGPEELWIPCIPLHPNCCCLWSIRRKLTNQAGKNAEAILAGLRKKRYVAG